MATFDPYPFILPNLAFSTQARELSERIERLTEEIHRTIVRT